MQLWCAFVFEPGCTFSLKLLDALRDRIGGDDVAGTVVHPVTWMGEAVSLAPSDATPTQGVHATRGIDEAGLFV